MDDTGMGVRGAELADRVALVREAKLAKFRALDDDRLEGPELDAAFAGPGWIDRLRGLWREGGPTPCARCGTKGGWVSAGCKGPYRTHARRFGCEGDVYKKCYDHLNYLRKKEGTIS